MKLFVSFVLAFDQIKISTFSAPQNDRLNLSFVKDINLDGEKMPINSPEMLITRSTMK
jgi:hypothetical protein